MNISQVSSAYVLANGVKEKADISLISCVINYLHKVCIKKSRLKSIFLVSELIY